MDTQQRLDAAIRQVEFWIGNLEANLESVRESERVSGVEYNTLPIEMRIADHKDFLALLKGGDA